MFKRLIFLLSFFALLSCSTKQVQENRVIIGIASGANTLNPMYAFNLVEGNITEILFLSLFEYHWNAESGEIEPRPMIAKDWKWSPDLSYLDIKLRNGLHWSDGEPITLNDIIHSFELYSNPTVNSRMYGSFNDFYLNVDGSVDLERSFEKLSDDELRIKFKPNSKPDYFDLDFPILPYHYFKNVSFADIEADSFQFSPVTSGPYKIKEWYRGQFIKLIADTTSYLVGPESVREIIFKVVPEYASRLNQLMNGEIDLMEDIKTADIDLLSRQSFLTAATVEGREYDYFGWNQYDPQKMAEGVEKPNTFFKDVKVRKALSHLIDRSEIVENYLKNYAQECLSPVSPIYKKYQVADIKAPKFDITEAKRLLTDAGWIDKNGDGVIEKGALDFEFTLSYPTGNPRREFAVTKFAANAEKAGIKISLQPMQMGSLIEGMQRKSLDAWAAAWFIPIPLDLRTFWYSEQIQAPLNFQGFKNEELDKAIDEFDAAESEAERITAVRKFQKIIVDLQPAAFLYWVDNIIYYNSKIQNIEIDPLGVIHHCWNWRIAD